MPHIEVVSKGRIYRVLFDEEDRGAVEAKSWHILSTSRGVSYAIAHTHSVSGARSTVGMHRVILQAAAGEMVDHINGDGLDNRRCNIRLCSREQNGMNRRRPAHNTTGYKGVKRHSKTSALPWEARICAQREHLHLGSFATREEAARAYDRAAIKLHGEFASLNFPRSDYE